jgi:hypothetical protein
MTIKQAVKTIVKKKIIKGHNEYRTRHEKIAELAYLHAEQLGFENTDPVENWLWAEKFIDGQK